MIGFGPPDPGDCLICGTAHCACGGPTAVVQLPQRDAAVPAVIGIDLAAGPDHSTVVERPPMAPLGDGSDGEALSTATYRGTRKKRGTSSRP